MQNTKASALGVQMGEQVMEFLTLHGDMAAQFIRSARTVSLRESRQDRFVLGHGLFQPSAQMKLHTAIRLQPLLELNRQIP